MRTVRKVYKENGISIHETAEVDHSAIIGEGTYVWNNCQVRRDAKIGKGCNLGKDVFIDFEVEIGNGVKIQNGVSVYHGVTIEDDAFLGPHMTFTNDLFPRSFIGDWKVSKTKVKKGASIGANATIVCGTTLGKYSMVGAGSVVTKDIPDYGLVVGVPARLIGFVGKMGQKLQVVSENEDSYLMKCPVDGSEYEIPRSDYMLFEADKNKKAGG